MDDQGCNDQSFGPYAGLSCRGGFDFTLMFEQTVLWALPSTLFMLLFVVRSIWLLTEQSKVVTVFRLQLVKLVLTSTYACLQLALVILWTSHKDRTPASVPGAIIALISACFLLILSTLEHLRSVRPAPLLIAYYAITTLFDVTQTRTLLLQSASGPIPIVLLTGIAFKVLLLIVESQTKSHELSAPYNCWPPEPITGPISRYSFWWLKSLLWSGFRRHLLQKDLYDVDPDIASGPLGQHLDDAWRSLESMKKHRLLYAAALTTKWPIFSAVPPRLCQSGFTFAQPFFINRIISFLDSPQDSQSRNVGFGLIGATFMIYLGLSFSIVAYKHKTYRLIAMMRGALVSMIYNKTLKIDSNAVHDSAAVTLMSTDIDRIALGLIYAHEMWASLLDVCVATYLLERQIGIVCIFPILIALTSTLGGVQVARKIGRRSELWVSAVQSRVNVTSNMLQTIKALKMSNLVGRMSSLVQDLRLTEVGLAKYYLRLDAWMNVFASAPTFIAPAITFIGFAFIPLGSGTSLLTSSTAFTALSILSIMTTPISLLINAFPTFFAGVACFKRIESYLLCPDRHDQRIWTKSVIEKQLLLREEKTNRTTTTRQKPHRSSLGHSQDDRDDNADEYIARLDHADICYEHKHIILRNVSLQIKSGTLALVYGPTGAGKSTLLKAILGETLVIKGSIYHSISSIAYCGQDPWLVNSSLRDNILSGLPYEEAWYRSVIEACALQADFISMPDGDSSTVGSSGSVLSGGQKSRVALARAVYSRKPLLVLDDCLSSLDAFTQTHVFSMLFGVDGLCQQLHSTTILVTQRAEYAKHAQTLIIISDNGCVKHIDQLGKSQMTEFIAEKCTSGVITTSTTNKVEKDQPIPSDDETKQIYQQRTGDWQVYKYYIASIGIKNCLYFLVLTCIYVFCLRFSQVWLGIWIQALSVHPGLVTKGIYGGIYVVFGFGALIFFYLAVLFMFQRIVPRSAAGLHKTLLDATMLAPYTFLTTLDVGTILNRFSQDMALIDLDLPSHALETVFYLVNSGGQIVLIAIASEYVSTAIPIIIVVVCLIQKFYLRTSRQMRLLDLEAKSPLYSHMLDTYAGLLNIRAMGDEVRFGEFNRRILDESQKPYYMLYCIQRWLNIVLALLVGCLAVILVTLAVELRGTTSGSTIGVALVNIISFNDTLSKLVTSWTSLETSLGAVARVKDFVSGVPEDGDHNERDIPDPAWPSCGNITFEQIRASYGASFGACLDDVSLHISPGMKIGICGRTGSGKSSLMLTLCKMLPLSSGAILIDGKDISMVSKDAVLKAMSVIAQEPLILPGTVRFNLDQDSSRTDADLISSLVKVSLWSIIFPKGGLDADLSSVQLSHGQNQLFSCARALLNASKTKILLMDEATAHLDNDTQAKIQGLVQEDFRHHTVLAVAHRVETIIDFDFVAVLDHGRLVELGKPRELLEIDSHFKKLYECQAVST